jgi:ribosomal protein L27
VASPCDGEVLEILVERGQAVDTGNILMRFKGTDCHIAEELVELGIPKEDIVLDFQTPYRRQFTEYALN